MRDEMRSCDEIGAGVSYTLKIEDDTVMSCELGLTTIFHMSVSIAFCRYL
jgi:hypothetical protein